MRLKELSVLMTLHCNINCAHCFLLQKDRQNREILAPEKLTTYLSAMGVELPRTILIYGGEPFLYLDTLLAYIKIGNEFNVNVKIITNGFWGNNKKRCHEILSKLQRLNIKHLVLSVDDFHQQHIPLKSIITILQTARALNFKKIALASVHTNQKLPGNHNQKTKRLLMQLQPFKDVIIDDYHFPLLMIGEAVKLIPSELTHELPNQTCLSQDCYGPSFTNIDSLDLYPNGDLVFCAGIVIGNANQTPINIIANTFKPANHHFMNLIALQGTDALQNEINQKTSSTHRTGSQPKHFDICHACFKGQKQLKNELPHELR